ncbi:MAG: RHS repeat-associated core domain-containing protein [Pirellulaceae bacterium]
MTTTFLVGYDGINPTLAFDGGTTADVSNRFLWGQMVDQLFADEQITNPSSAGNVLWALGDHLGTIRDLVDFNGSTYSITNHRVYDSFGRLTSETNAAVDMVFAYTGKYFDEITQLSNHWNRWYDPQSGKWISEDPIGFVAGDANLTRYVNNEVVIGRDHFGLFSTETWRYDSADHGAPHIQKGAHRYDANTLRPIPHKGVTPPPLTAKDITEIIDQGVFDEVTRAHPNSRLNQIANDLEERVFQRLEERGAKDLIKGEKRAIVKSVLRRLALPLVIVFVVSDVAEGGVEKAAKNAIIPGELIEELAKTIVDDWQVYSKWWFGNQREKMHDKRIDSVPGLRDHNFNRDFPERVEVEGDGGDS